LTVAGGWLAGLEPEAEFDFEAEVDFVAEADLEAKAEFAVNFAAEEGFEAEAVLLAEAAPAAFSCTDPATATPDDVAEKTAPAASTNAPDRSARAERNMHADNTRLRYREVPTPRRSRNTQVRRSNTGWPGRSG
jgi:hypothetical protein